MMSIRACHNESKMPLSHYNDVIMGAIASQITSLTIVYSTVYSDADQRKHQSSALLAFVRGIHRGPVNSPHKWPVTRKVFPSDDVIMTWVMHCKNHYDHQHGQHFHGWPPTQPGSLHTAVQRKYTLPCSLFSRGTAVWTMGARLCEQWGTAVCKCPAV